MPIIPTAPIRRLARAGLCSSLLAATQIASAGPLTFDTFAQFSFDTVGAAVRGCDPADPAGAFCVPSSGTPTTFLDAPTWTFTAPAGGATLTVVDAFTAGDEFSVFDFDVLVGSTSAAVGRPLPDCGDDPVACLATFGMSRGVFSFAEGPHSISLVATRLADGLGSAYLRLEAGSAVPEPASLALMLGALGVMSGIRRRRGANTTTGSAA